jgi:hypothetical protein
MKISKPNRKRIACLWGAALFFLLIPAAQIRAQEEELLFQAVDLKGFVQAYRDETEETRRLHLKGTLDDGDRVTTQEGDAVLRMPGRAYLYLAPHTQVHITRLRMGERGPQIRLNLLKGRMVCQLDEIPQWAFEVSAGSLICRAHGTLFEVSRKKEDVQVVCFEGNVVASSLGHSQMAKANQVVRFGAGKFRYRRYLRIGEETELSDWHSRLKGIQEAKTPVHP